MLKQQEFLSEIYQPDHLSIEDTAKILSVSSATVRNWVKTGYLSLYSRGKVDKNSILLFQQEQLGKNKLISRANKSQKDKHNHHKLSSDILIKLKEEQPEKLGAIYENSLSDSYRNKEGIYYTPAEVVRDLFSITENVMDKTFCDPCCGSGNFIVRALELGFKPENIYGFDIDPIAIEITKKRIKDLTGYDSRNIICCNFLEKSLNQSEPLYDYIYTNPPWGKKIDKSDKMKYANILRTGASNDTSSLFFFLCLSLLKQNGKLGLLLPEAFFYVTSYEKAREEILKYQLLNLKDYGKAFKGLQTGAVAFVLNKRLTEGKNYINCQFQEKNFSRNQLSFAKNPKSIFNINCNSNEAELISYLYTLPHQTLANNARWGLGIVTGNNTKHLKSEYKLGLIPVFKGSDITKEGLKEPTNFISTDFSQYQQVAPLELFEAKEKLLYKFISSNLCFFYDNKQTYPLNSANMLIVNNNFPVSMKLLAELFNSNFMNWLFKKLFNTHKVLRGDLELLPIFTNYLSGGEFNEQAYLELLNVEKTNNGTYRVKN